ncbi:C-C chemokine receptor type 7-like [Babylonia areolata]|uniref:C-C chemokine receptor type 7-like n=1 Tax=Babylonia areolata TaxID=304850 RepID=UPI003FD04250
MDVVSVFPDSQNDSITGEYSTRPSEEIPLDSIPLYNIANYLFSICCPIIIFLGLFGNVMTIVIMHRMTSGDTVINYYFTAMAVMDLIVLFFSFFTEWVFFTFHYRLQDSSSVACKLIIWMYTGSGTVSCWYLVCLTLHRAMSVVWPHRVNVLCSRRAVLGLITGIGLFFAALYAHYLFGMDLVSSDGDTSYRCSMKAGNYISFVSGVFTYIELTIYSVLPFLCLVLGNCVLVRKLFHSVKDIREKLNQGNSEQILARQRTANSVTVTVIVVSIAFIVLTLPVSINYILSYFAYEYREVSGYEYAKAHLTYTVCYLLADSNSAINFYLYCLTGRRFREEFFRVIRCGRVTK